MKQLFLKSLYNNRVYWDIEYHSAEILSIFHLIKAKGTNT
jgi:hypothetical protein